MPKVTTKFDVELAEWNLKILKLKADLKQTEEAAKQAKLGEHLAKNMEEGAKRAAAKMEAAMKKSTVLEFRGMKESAEKAAAEAARAAAAQWKAIITPAITDSWRVHQAGSGGMTGYGAFGRGIPGGSKLAMGNLGMQVQDIAVQAQMGTSALTIMAQQGSQVASIFGTSGMIIGGIVAIGGALLLAGAKSNEAFNKMIDGAMAFHKELGKIAADGNLDATVASMGRLVKQQEEIAKLRRETLNGGLWELTKGTMGVMSGGDTLAEKRYKLDTAQRQMRQDEMTINNTILTQAEDELAISKLRLENRDREADLLEKQIKLRRELREIEYSDVSDPAKKALSAAAIARSQIEEAKAGRDSVKEAEAARQAKATLSKQLAAAEKETDQAGMTDAQKLAALGADLRKTEGQIASAKTDEEKIKLGIEREQIEKRIIEMQKQFAEEAKRQAETEKKEADDRGKRIAALQKEISDQAFEMLPKPDKIQALMARIKSLGGQIATETDEEKKLKLVKEQMDTQEQLTDLQSEKVKTAKTPGGVAAAINTIFGRSANELILDESRRQTQVLERIDRGIQKLAEGGDDDPFGGPTFSFP
jgi:hypothetical protein